MKVTGTAARAFIVAVLGGLAASGASPRADAGGGLAPSSAAMPARFPLRVAGDRRHLTDSDGQPFLIVGDTAWSLIAQLGEGDIARYLDDRARRGFNAIIVNLLEHKFAEHAPATRDGIAPFLQPMDFARPNPPYYAFAHRAVEAANRRGITVWLCPAYLGWGGKDEGFFAEIKASGPAALREYGRFVGRTFKDLPNIVWMPGGDFALAEGKRWAGSELAVGLREGGAEQIMTAHGGQTSAVETYGDPPWLAVDTVYRYQPDLWLPLRQTYGLPRVRPFVLIETTYEGEHDASAGQIRRQAWWAMLSGACGQFFGNNPIWHFDGPGLFAVPVTWQEALDSRGSRDIARLAAFFRVHPWSGLVPDVNDTRVTAGRGEGATFVVAARTAGAKPMGIVYIPNDGKSVREFTLDLSDFPGLVAARWFNPAVDAATVPAQPSLPNRKGQIIRTPGDNGTGANDWVLVLATEGS